MNNRDLIEQLKTRRIVTAPRGSWKWQDAYRVAEYQAAERADGTLVWKCVYSSDKLSMPQVLERGLGQTMHGSIHNKTVSRKEAVTIIGAEGVKKLERNGWRFADTAEAAV